MDIDGGYLVKTLCAISPYTLHRDSHTITITLYCAGIETGGPNVCSPMNCTKWVFCTIQSRLFPPFPRVPGTFRGFEGISATALLVRPFSGSLSPAFSDSLFPLRFSTIPAAIRSAGAPLVRLQYDPRPFSSPGPGFSWLLPFLIPPGLRFFSLRARIAPGSAAWQYAQNQYINLVYIACRSVKKCWNII